MIKFPKVLKEYYIYTRYDNKNYIFKIFVKLFKKTNVNNRKYDIYFVIIINKEFPVKPPIVNCLSDVKYYFFYFLQFAFPTLNDNSNLLNSLISNWGSNIKISDIINKIPFFLNNIEDEFRNKLLSYYGTYSIKSDIYNINDFLLDNVIKLVKIKICIRTDNGLNFEPRFLIITDLNILILNPIDTNNKILCQITFCGEIVSIQNIKKLTIDDSELEEKFCIKFIWEPGAPNIYLNKISLPESEINSIIDLIMNKKKSLKTRFNYFENKYLNNIQEIEKIISIKEKILKREEDEYIYRGIIELYRKIIEICTIQNDDGFQKYINQLHNIIEKYDGLQKTKK